MQYKTTVTLVLVLFLSTIYQLSSAQQSSDLNKIWEQVTQEYPGLQAHDAHIETLRIDSIVALSDYWPKLHIQYQQSVGSYAGSSGIFYPLPGIFNVSGGSSQLTGDANTFNSYGSTVASWDILTLGRKTTDRALSSLQIKKAQSDYGSYILSLREELATRYFNTLYYKNVEHWSTSNAQRLFDILEVAKSLSISGIRPMADTLISSSAYRQVLAQHEETIGMMRATQEYLYEFVGGINLELPLEARKLRGTTLHLEKGDITFDRHPLVRTKDIENQHIEMQSLAETKSALPKLSLLGGLSTRTSGISDHGTVSHKFTDGYNNRANNYFLGAGITWSMDQAFRSRKKSKSYQQELVAQELELNSLKQSLQTRYHAIDQQVLQSYKQLSHAEKSVKEAEEAYAMYLVRYEGGLINLSELLQIQQILQATEKTYLDLLLHFWSLQVQQKYLRGDLSPIYDQF